MLQVAAVAVVGSVCAVLLGKQQGELALLLGLGTCGVVLYLVLEQFSGLVALIRELVDCAEVDSDLVRPLMKTAAVAIVTMLTASVARDAGQTAIAATVQLCGSLLALCLAAPLIHAVLTLVAELL
ncbi:MAG: stage III sporulation protein AD [Clostridiales bacterium]|nr:stage III sporulation protein AD [Clostridiales bacterium]